MSGERFRFIGVASLLMSGWLNGTVLGAVPTYSTFQLHVRSNLCANVQEGTFNIPCNHFFNSSTPWTNNCGRIAVKLDVIGSTGGQGVWSSVNAMGGIVYTSPADASVSDPTINNAGYIVFSQSLSSQNGLYFYNTRAMMGGLRTTQPFGTSSWGSAQVNDLEQIGFRANFSGAQALYSFDPNGPIVLHAAEAGLDPQSPYSFLFSPTFNNNRQIAAHVRLGAAGQTGNSQPDQIRIFNADGTSIMIAQDVDANASSPYTAFDSSRPAMADDGRVAFIANRVGGGRGVFVSNGTTTLTIATTTTPGVTVIDSFPPSMNNSGLVVFRGRDGSNLSAIFVGDGKSLRRVIGQNDIVPSDNGPARIAQHDSSPVFGGAPTINSRGDITFNCALTPADNNQIEWGSGIYVAYAAPPARPGDIDGNGFVNIDDLFSVISAWGPCPAPTGICPADVAPSPCGNGFVNIDDLFVVISHWG
jgi:hypothetical protein